MASPEQSKVQDAVEAPLSDTRYYLRVTRAAVEAAVPVRLDGAVEGLQGLAEAVVAPLAQRGRGGGGRARPRGEAGGRGGGRRRVLKSDPKR